MGNLSNVKKTDILLEFQTFLLEKKLAPAKVGRDIVGDEAGG
jgi:hypothetical protein